MIQAEKYLGFDISHNAISRCKKLFQNDHDKTFLHMSKFKGETAELTLSIDVIYHLIEDHIFEDYMEKLFNSSMKYVIIYSSNIVGDTTNAFHVKHRYFTDWISDNKPEWKLIKHVPNKYPAYRLDSKIKSSAEFYFYQINV